MALDAGTSSVRAILFDEKGAQVAVAQRPLTITYPQPGWVQQDPIEILSRTIACMVEVQFTSGIHSSSIACVGITNQRETVVVWDRATGQPVYDAIVWQCRRTAPTIERLEREGAGGYSASELASLVRDRTGLVLDPYFSATKIAWILDTVPGARARAKAGELLCGTVDTWLIYNLTHGQVHATDYTNASRTLLFDIKRLAWDQELCELFGVPAAMLPAAYPSDHTFGRVSSDIMRHHPPIAGVAGDQQAALFGQACFEPGSVKTTYGTGCFMLMNVGATPLASTHGLLTTVGIAQGGELAYALEGSVFQAGSVIQWLRDEMGLIATAAQSEELARQVESANGCTFVPAFTGIGAPWWDPNARGLITGITRDTSRAHVVRAACEAIAFQAADVLAAMEQDAHTSITCVNVDGGAAQNNFIMEFQANILGRTIARAQQKEATAQGAAFLAGLACGLWSSREELAHLVQVERVFTPTFSAEKRAGLQAQWHEAVARACATPQPLVTG
jgi:glycerol kinase